MARWGKWERISGEARGGRLWWRWEFFSRIKKGGEEKRKKCTVACGNIFFTKGKKGSRFSSAESNCLLAVFAPVAIIRRIPTKVYWGITTTRVLFSTPFSFGTNISPRFFLFLIFLGGWMAIFFWSEPPPYYHRKQLLRDPWELEELRTGGSGIFFPSSTESCESMCTG